MTYEQAMAALRLAPADDQESKVISGLTRRRVVEGAFEALQRAFHHSVIDLPPETARRIAAIVQDWPDPVDMRFIFNPEELPGENISVGWNQAELLFRKNGLKTTKLDPDQMAAHVEKQKRDEMFRQIQHADAARPMSKFEELCRKIERDRMMAKANSILSEASSAKPKPEPKPEPPPDPHSPTFVLKRPKLK